MLNDMEKMILSITSVVLLTLFPWWLASLGLGGTNLILAWYGGLLLGLCVRKI